MDSVIMQTLTAVHNLGGHYLHTAKKHVFIPCLHPFFRENGIPGALLQWLCCHVLIIVVNDMV